MLNRITGWLLFVQAFYLAAFIALATCDAASGGAVSKVISGVRREINLPNSIIRMRDYLYYPMVFSAPINVALMIILFWIILRRGFALSFTSDFFNIINAIYVASSGWVLFIVFTNLLKT